jgi:hypothetical protein
MATNEELQFDMEYLLRNMGRTRNETGELKDFFLLHGVSSVKVSKISIRHHINRA